MPEIEMFVGLKIPDTTALTALRALHSMGMKSIRSLVRENYYKFYFDGDEKQFRNEISKVDIIVNANKNYFKFSDNGLKCPKVLVKDADENPALAKLLETGLGLKNIKKVESGILWSIGIEGNKKEVAKRAAEELFANEHYQSYDLL